MVQKAEGSLAQRLNGLLRWPLQGKRFIPSEKLFNSWKGEDNPLVVLARDLDNVTIWGWTLILPKFCRRVSWGARAIT